MNGATYSNAHEAEFLKSPALRIRKQGYPERFNGRVPRIVRPRRTVRPDIPFLAPADCVALQSNTYLAWTNSYGAVAAVTPGGKLGLKPDEFDVVEWADETTVLVSAAPHG